MAPPGHNPTPADQPASGGVVIAPGVVVPEALLQWQFSRSGGPGGQNVNKVSTKAELRLAVDAIPISHRARRRLRELAGRRIAGSEPVVDPLTGQSHDRGGELILTSESERSQSGNKSECLARLRELLVEAMAVPKVRRKTKPSRASKARRVDEKKRRGDIKKGRGRPDH
jgi:ribosome-associated protein